jgi:putative DNA primase/helicase
VLNAIRTATGIRITTLRAEASQAVNDSEPDHLALARMTLATVGGDNVIHAEHYFWIWEGRGVWNKRDDIAIKKQVQTTLDANGFGVTAAKVSGVTDVLRNEIYRPDHVFNIGNPDVVNCRNGELELTDTGWCLQPHRREHYRTTQIPVAFDASATAPMFLAFLNDVFRDDPDKDFKIWSLLELIGYTLMSHAKHERFIMLIGGGANGKSVLLSVIEALTGMKNVAGVQPGNFDNRFQRAHLHQKLANIVTELKQGEIIADAELKAITSGELTTVEDKQGHPFEMRAAIVNRGETEMADGS